MDNIKVNFDNVDVTEKKYNEICRRGRKGT